MRKPRHSALLLVVSCSLAGLALPAHAYLDPSTGSMILSAIVGLFATIGMAIKTYWYKLKNLFSGRPAAPPPADGAEAGGSGTQQANPGASRSSRPS